MKNLSTAMKSSPSSLHLEKAHMQQQRPSVAKKFKKQKQKNIFKKKKKGWDFWSNGTHIQMASL